MAGVLAGVKVLDLSWGISGPAATMLLADNGAEVTRIERPQGDPFDGYLDYKTYNRGKRSAVLDLRDPADRDRFLALARTADDQKTMEKYECLAFFRRRAWLRRSFS